MKSLRRFFARLANFATRRAQDERLREVIDEHIALQTVENLRAGLSPVEARRRAMLKLAPSRPLRKNIAPSAGCCSSKIFCRMRAMRSAAYSALPGLPPS